MRRACGLKVHAYQLGRNIEQNGVGDNTFFPSKVNIGQDNLRSMLRNASLKLKYTVGLRRASNLYLRHILFTEISSPPEVLLYSVCATIEPENEDKCTSK